MKVLLIAAAASLGAACATPLDAPQSPTFGQAVASMQAQIVPVSVVAAPPETSGLAAADAIRRLERGERRKLETQATSDLNINLIPVEAK